MPFDLHAIGNLLIVYGINVLGALVIALVGWWAAGLLERITRSALMAATHMDPIVGAFLSSLTYYAVLVLAFVLMLQVVGIQATSLVAVLGAASLAIGLALQGTLSNMAAGVMLLIFRPFHLGDRIEVGGKNGTVRNLNLFMTELSSGENVQVLIPNGQVWGAAITNFSAYSTHSMSLKFAVGFDQDANSVTSQLQRYLEDDDRVLQTPAPKVTMSSLTEKGIEVSAQAWTKNDDADVVRAALLEKVLTTVKPA